MLRGMGQDTSAGPEKLSEPRRLSRLSTGKHTHAHEVNVHDVDDGGKACGAQGPFIPAPE